jgi:exopolyphosphatase/guanosine-5'-triphosphate,3'-diphosphate pyrophosphatase
VTVYLVRHAVAVRRTAWTGPERFRPLSSGGHRQAHRLVDLLGRAPLERIVSSPHLRCRQTVEPLAAHRGLALESDPRLEVGASLPGALELLAALGTAHAALCSHGDLVPGLIEHLCARGLRLDGALQCAKGSVWVLEGAPAAPLSASYVPPPAKSRQRGRVRDPDGDLGEPQREGGGKQRLAVIDLGSTSFHLLVVDAQPDGEIRRVLREREMLRLGASIASGGRIRSKMRRRVLECARELRRHAERAGATRLLAVATAALRDAANGRELAARIGEVLGSPVRVLSGREEARVIFAAFRERLALRGGRHLGLDLGGGSLELAVGDDVDVHWEETLRLGVARLHRELVRRDPMGSGAERAVRGRVRELLAPCLPQVRQHRPESCVATGGTVGALARLVATRRTSWPTRRVGQLFVLRSELEELAAELLASNHEQRLAMPGMQKQRADLLPTGALVLETALAELGVDGFTVSDWGLREGVILVAVRGG